MIHTRLSNEHDAPVIAEFQIEMAKETEDLDLERTTVADGVFSVFRDPQKGKYYVATEKDEIVASMLITQEWSDWRNSWFWWVQSVYVEKSHRRKGIYSHLYNEVISKCKKSEQTYGIRLYVEKENKIAQKVYSDLGMRETNYLLYETHL